MNTAEDCWIGRAHDAKSLLDPSNGSTLTWTGETILQRVYPKASEGKVWCNGELIRTRRGSNRTPDIHPLHWWLMSEKGRLLAQDEWEVKLGEIFQAQNGRSIPRVQLDKMPPGEQTSALQSRGPAMPSFFLRSDASTLRHNELNWLWPPAMVCTTTEDFEDEHQDEEPPPLVYESEDEYSQCQIGESYDDCSSTCLLYTSPSPRDKRQSRMPSSA